jgi:drug/metabolite transporter (DMT)-like permease
MGYWKVRLFALAAIALSAWITYSNWQEALTESTYDMRVATFGPVMVVFGVFLFFFPTKIGRPETTKDKIITMLVFGVGLAAGFYNWYLMDPQRFDGLIKVVSSVL